VYCDGIDTLEEMIQAAIEKGFHSVGFSGHSYMHYSLEYGMSLEGTKVYQKEIAMLKKQYANLIDIYCGCELDLYSEVDLDGFDYIIGSFHYFKSVSKRKEGYVTDGPFLYRSKEGELFCIWSSLLHTGYAQLYSKSNNGDIDGEWEVIQTPIYAEDGGHGMLFTDLEGKTRFVMHSPNTATLERPVLLDITLE
jgi:histidinol phosphatase-like PHP family hydrolase